MSAMLDWVDAETPHAKVPRNGDTLSPNILEHDPDIQAALARIAEFEGSLLRESREQPMVIADGEDS
jgi:hypothetical protein